MEIVVTLSNINNLSKLNKSKVDGVLFGGPFSLRFNYSIDELKTINEYCLNNNLKRYITIDSFIFEDDKVSIYDYFEYLKDLNPDGIYFTDLGIISISKEYGLNDRLIYDPDTLMTNSLDALFYLNKGIGVVLSRELTFDEVKKILNNTHGKVDMQVFGHLKMSYSKREFLTNYFKHINKDVDIKGNKHLKLVEENRDYGLLIYEDKYGTRIYTDYILFMYKELLEIKDKINRAIVDDSFIEDSNLVFDVIRDIKTLSYDNINFLTLNINTKYPNVRSSQGYLYKKTSLVKENEDE